MNYRTLIPTLFLGGLLVACAEKKTTVATTTPPPASRTTAQPRKAEPPTPAQQGPRFGGVAKADSLFFTLEKTPCFGQCKAYRINVYRSGFATFEGRANVEKEGMHRGFVGKDTLETLMRDAEKMEFFNLKDKYDGQVTDLPSTIIRVVGMGKDKKVTGRVGTPEAFTRFATKAEGLLYPVAWRPVAPVE